MTTTVVPTTSLRPGQVAFFNSAMTLFHPSRAPVTHWRGLLTTAFSIRAPLMSILGGVGRPRGTRTPNLRFWRPLLCQLSYWPAIAAKACKSTPLATYSPCLTWSPGQPCAFGRNGRTASVPTFALGALKGDDFSACARHVRSFKLVEPSTRFELVTPSLPRTCSTPELRGPSSVLRTEDWGLSFVHSVLSPHPSVLALLERETGFEPATNSLEGCDSTPELLPRLVERGGFEPP